MEKKNAVNKYFACARTVKPAAALVSRCSEKSDKKYPLELIAFNQEQINWFNCYTAN
ncbi:MAG: hypothetical protein ACIAQZ_06085 [Sedimentisphaeraceae bacterium JB056]